MFIVITMALSIATFTYAVVNRMTATRAAVGRRVVDIAGTPAPLWLRDGKQKNRDGRPGDKSGRRAGARNGNLLATLETALRSADISVRATEFLTRGCLIGAIFTLVLYLAVGPAALLLVPAVSVFGTLFYLRLRARRRMNRFNDGLHDMLTILGSSLRAGHSFIQALHVVSEDMHGPIQDEVRRVIAETQVGVGVEEALMRANERVDSEDFDLIVTAVAIQRQVGGNLAEVVERIAKTIRERTQLKREVKALTSQGRMSAWIFMALPPGLGAILFVINPTYIGVLFTSPLGIGMLIVAVMGQLIGYMFIRRIVNVEL